VVQHLVSVVLLLGHLVLLFWWCRFFRIREWLVLSLGLLQLSFHGD
jgi:hypothetical protein